ncbi:MAG: hypothetical protein ABSA52_13005 [Candidatus Binatia bacterium]
MAELGPWTQSPPLVVLATIVLVIPSVPLSLWMPPPEKVALLPEKVQLVTVTVPP